MKADCVEPDVSVTSVLAPLAVTFNAALAKARSVTSILSVARNHAETTIRVSDDGPGLPPERLREVMGRGVRLDETVSGSGLGL